MSAASFAKNLAALDDVLQFVGGAVRALGGDERSVATLELVAEELFTNAVKYGSRASAVVSVALERHGTRLRLELVDEQAAPFDLADVAPVDITAPLAQRQPGGLGLHLVRQLMDDVSVRWDQGRLTVTATRTVEAVDA